MLRATFKARTPNPVLSLPCHHLFSIHSAATGSLGYLGYGIRAQEDSHLPDSRISMWPGVLD